MDESQHHTPGRPDALDNGKIISPRRSQKDEQRAIQPEPPMAPIKPGRTRLAMTAPNDFYRYLRAGTLDHTWPALNRIDEDRRGNKEPRIPTKSFYRLTALFESIDAAMIDEHLGPLLRKRINTDAADYFAAKIKRVFEEER